MAEQTWAYYNEFDPAAAEWIRELIRSGEIAPGEVDERSILDVRADDLLGFTQCHAGGGKGRDDERHLAPHFLDLVRAGRPAVLFGEQVASADVFGKVAGKAGKGAAAPPAWAWLDDVSDRLEAARYAVGASDIPSAGVGAPHIRQRTFFGAYDLGLAASGVADSTDAGRQRRSGPVHSRSTEQRRSGLEHDGTSGGVEHTDGRNTGAERQQPCGEQRLQQVGGGSERLADADRGQRDRIAGGEGCERDGAQAGRVESDREPERSGEADRPGPTNGFWRDADWLGCRDGKWRPVEPGLKPLAHGIPGRVGLLRGYGNAINPWAAKIFIEAFEEVMREMAA